MYEIKIIPSKKPIVYFNWEGRVTVDLVEKSTEDLLSTARKVGQKYYFIADARKTEVMTQDAQKALVEQQKAVMGDIILSAVIVGEKALHKMQLGKTGNESGTKTKEQFFASVEEAIKYIESL